MAIEIADIKGEYREGYYVASMMKRFWAAQLVVLAEIDRICTKYNLTWYASWGTCLGAVRHKGYIPWDDDIDIEMPRKDYELFKKYCKQELKSPMVLGDVLSGNFDNLVSRVVNTEYHFCLEQDFLTQYYGCPYQAGVDIFCVDHIPDDPAEANLLCQLVKAAYNVGAGWDKTDEKVREEQFAFLVATSGIPCPPERSKKVHALYLADRFSAMYMEEETEYSGIIYYYYNNERRKMPTRSLTDIIRMPFEGFNMPVLRDYETYLTTMFGDWKNPVVWGEHPYLSGRIQELREALEKKGQQLPPELDLIKEK